jgi:hypothetical protein
MVRRLTQPKKRTEKYMNDDVSCKKCGGEAFCFHKLLEAICIECAESHGIFSVIDDDDTFGDLKPAIKDSKSND